jgi:deoxyuridine 5'-triphosphate nucleotidohydrolase
MNFYETGKNYLISCIKLDYEVLFQHNNLLDFLRGYIELNSALIKPDFNNFKATDETIFNIYFTDLDIKIPEYIKNNYNICCDIIKSNYNKNNIYYNYILQFKFVNVLDILSKIYHKDVKESEVDEELYNEYMTLSNYQHIYYDCENDNLYYRLPKCTFKINNKSAIVPSKKNASDIGYDLTIIKTHKRISDNIIMYDTGIQVKPQYGYYFEIVPRSSLSKSGYILANSIGIIDPSYSGNLYIVLIKIDDNLPDLQLPFKCCQLLLRRSIHYELHETTNNLIETNRGSGGFGSTNKK